MTILAKCHREFMGDYLQKIMYAYIMMYQGLIVTLQVKTSLVRT